MIKDIRDTISSNLERLRALPEDEDLIKEIVCTFYRGGSCPECRGCMQPTDTLLECKTSYVSKIEATPIEKWVADFDKLKIRDKIPIKELIDLGLNCNKCYMSDTCPLYLANNLCGIDWGEEVTDPKKMIEGLIEIQYVRINRAAKIEQVDGGVPDQTLSLEMDRMQGLIQSRNDFDMDKFQVRITGQSQSGSSNEGGGILSKLFGGKTTQEISAPMQEPIKIEDTTHTVIPFEELPKKVEVIKPVEDSKTFRRGKSA